MGKILEFKRTTKELKLADLVSCGTFRYEREFGLIIGCGLGCLGPGGHQLRWVVPESFAATGLPGLKLLRCPSCRRPKIEIIAVRPLSLTSLETGWIDFKKMTRLN